MRRHGDRYFDEDVAGDLKGRSVRGGVVTMAGQGVGLALQLGSTAVLARLLSPEEYGLFGMVMVVVGFAGIFMDAGLSTATVQRASITHEQVSVLFFANALAGVVLTGLVMAVSPLIAWVYGEPELVWYSLVVAWMFLVTALGVQHRALLRRSMHFGRLRVADVIGQAGGVAVGVAMAWWGMGVWSLVGMTLGQQALVTTASWVVCGWRPGRPRRGSGVRAMLGFGANLTGASVANYFARHGDQFLLGWWHGTVELGLYGRAYRLLLFPLFQINRPIAAVGLPSLCRLQHDPERFRSYYKAGIELCTALGMPIVVYLAADAHTVIPFLLGEKWGGVIPIFRALAPAAMLTTFNVATGWVFVAFGHADRQLRLTVVITVLILAGIAAGLPWGATGLAVGYSTIQVLTRFPAILYSYRGTPMRMRDLLEALCRPVSSSVAAGAAMLVVDVATPDAEAIGARMLMNAGVFFGTYALLWLVVPGGRSTMWRYWQLFREGHAKPSPAVLPG